MVQLQLKEVSKKIQIQLLLKLNKIHGLMNLAKKYSNTTLVKVKLLLLVPVIK